MNVDESHSESQPIVETRAISVSRTRRVASRALLAIRHRRGTAIGAGALTLSLLVWLLLSRTGEGEAKTESTVTTTSATDTLLRLDTTAVRLAGVELMALAPTTSGTLTANGTITFDANRVSVVSPRVEGRLISVRADLGDRVTPGSVLAYLESPDIGQTRGDLERALANMTAAQRNYEREKRLFDQQISAQKELLEAENAYRTATADYNSARSRLIALGAGQGTGSGFGLVTPIGGTIVERNASPGQIVGPAVNVFTVADLRHVWITVDVYEGDLQRVRRGAEAVVVPTALPNETFSGRVTYAGGIVDPASHTFKVRVEVENESMRLRPGMFAQVRITTAPAAPGAQSVSLVVPEIAVQELGGKSVVFVAGGMPGVYSVRPVMVGARPGNGMIAISSGLSPGEQIVVKGAFQLKAQLSKASFAGDD